MALIELCDRHGATAKDRRALAALIDQIPEALNTPAEGKREHCSTRRSPPRPTPARCSARCRRVNVRPAQPTR